MKNLVLRPASWSVPMLVFALSMPLAFVSCGGTRKGGGGPEATGIDVAEAQTINVGETVTLTAAIVPPDAVDGDKATWVSDAPTIAAVAFPATGLAAAITGVAQGTANITVTTKDGRHSAACEVTVAAPVPVEPTMYVAGPFGLYADGVHDALIGADSIMDVVADGTNNVHATGQRHDASAPVPYAPIYYFNGFPTILPTTLPGVENGWLTSGNGICVTADGHVYIAGFEQNGSYTQVARLWRDGVRVPMAGIDETGSYWSRANAVCIRDGDIYVVGYRENQSYAKVSAIWKNDEMHTIAGSDDELSGMGFDSAGTMYVTRGPSLFKEILRVSPDLSSLEPVELGGTGLKLDMCADGMDIYVAGFSEYDAIYWKNGQRHVLPRPVGGELSEAYAIYANGGHAYIAGKTRLPSTHAITLWIDGAILIGTGAIADMFDDYSEAEPSAIFVK